MNKANSKKSKPDWYRMNVRYESLGRPKKIIRWNDYTVTKA